MIPSDPADRASLEEEHALELRAPERERKLVVIVARRGQEIWLL
jgi:hypothetical protein